jgi:hypothetical protein
MRDHFPLLSYTRESFNRARFFPKGQHPNDPEAQFYPIRAREQGTIVGSEDIGGLMEEFGFDNQDFRDA